MVIHRFVQKMTFAPLPALLLGLFLGGLIGLLAWRAGSLSRSGGLAAALSGGLIFGLGGLSWATVLLAFFISSSALSRLFSRRKAALDEKFSKGHQRDWGQVLANGGLGALLVIFQAIFPGQAWPWVAYTGAMAAVNADTWATELGVLSRAVPRLITTGKRVERGTSGGVTALGYLAALGGAGLIGLCAAAFAGPAGPLAGGVAAVLGGLAGASFDSFLGATVQAGYYCPVCQKETERHPRHLCGTETRQVGGWSWLDNDRVNFACSLAGALAALGVWALVR
jgi:uncharacterized protein (TIGR00297 family)